MKLSVVSTLYNSEKTLSVFYKLISKEAKKSYSKNYEIIFVDDGSSDSSLEIAREITRIDRRVSVIELSRNFGHHQAIMTGLSFAKGELIFLIDSDLEENPAWLSSFHQTLKQHHCDVVYGTTERREGTFFERLSGFVFYRAFRFLTGLSQPNNICTARLMTKNYVQALLSHTERELNFGALCLITGFKQFAKKVIKKNNSKTSYSLSKKLTHFVNAITSFSNTPLIFIFYVGVFISIASVFYFIYLFYRYFYDIAPPDGYTTIVASIWLFSGLFVLLNGIQGIYLAKIYLESKRRPISIIKSITRKSKT